MKKKRVTWAGRVIGQVCRWWWCAILHWAGTASSAAKSKYVWYGQLAEEFFFFGALGAAAGIYVDCLLFFLLCCCFR